MPVSQWQLAAAGPSGFQVPSPRLTWTAPSPGKLSNYNILVGSCVFLVGSHSFIVVFSISLLYGGQSSLSCAQQ